MPCPYFLPLAPRLETEWLRPPRAPLGALFQGECHAGPDPAPADHPLCNFGYARGECPRFPTEAPIDAIRFRRHGRAVIYCAEREHVPVESGEARWDGGGVLEAQARAFRAR